MLIEVGEDVVVLLTLPDAVLVQVCETLAVFVSKADELAKAVGLIDVEGLPVVVLLVLIEREVVELLDTFAERLGLLL